MSRIGPLTTAFTAPLSCLESLSHFFAPSVNTLVEEPWLVTGPVITNGCFAGGYEADGQFTYCSPGVCPAGYTLVCTMIKFHHPRSCYGDGEYHRDNNYMLSAVHAYGYHIAFQAGYGPTGRGNHIICPGRRKRWRSHPRHRSGHWRQRWPRWGSDCRGSRCHFLPRAKGPEAGR